MLPLDDVETTDETAEAVDLSAPADDTEETPGSPWEDLEEFVALPRIGELRLSPDGRRLVVGIARLTHDKTAYATSLWELDPVGERPAHRLTRSLEGDAAAAFTRAGDLLFTSKRATPKDGDDVKETTKALWCLPAAGGEAYPLARRDGGWSEVLTARDADTCVFVVPVNQGAADEEEDAKKRALRKEKKLGALLHEGFPVRFWDHDLGVEWPRLLTAEVRPDGELSKADFRPVGEDPKRSLTGSKELSPDGRTLITGWTEPLAHGQGTASLALIDTGSGERRMLRQGDVDVAWMGGVFNHDGTQVACLREERSTAERPSIWSLRTIDLVTDEEREAAPGWDRTPNPVAFSPDGATLYVTADEDGDHPLFAITLATGDVRRVTPGRGNLYTPCLSPDGTTVYALRTAWDNPGQIVAIDVATGEDRVIDCGVAYPALPGRLERVETTADDGVRIPGYLVVPDGASPEHPAKLALWVHGGPVSSWSGWSWRWCPWLLASQGYTVLMPDPALSTGYGWDFIKRGWGTWGDRPYTDVLALTDAIVARDDVDEHRTIAMGGSFGGYMANWIATHTDRFKAIVTHAALWNLTSFGPTTDAAAFWSREMTPAMMAEHSPHAHAANITTPMLVIHGDKDYRVPLGEGLALWWALNAAWDGKPEDLPHKFLYFPEENHWILSPQNAILWYATIRAFLATHVDGVPFARPEAL